MSIASFFDVEDDFTVGFDYDRNRQELIDNLEFLKSLSVEEQTLYKKWKEFNGNSFKNYSKKSKYLRYEEYLWKPTDIFNKELTIEEINNLDPIVEQCNSGNESKWSDVRQLIHSMDWSANPGRNQKFFVLDNNTKKILGLISCGSDVTSIGVRDNYIGWNKENKFEQGKLNHTLIASTIVATQPLGYNFLGGKLIAALATSGGIRDAWESAYNNVLVGVTTTSLYGIHSQYNGMPHFKTLGESTGAILIKPDDEVYLPWNNWLRENHPDEFQKAISKTGPKQNVLNCIFRHLGIKPKNYKHGFHRGVYFAQMYDNGNEFLRNEISQSDLKMKIKFEQDVEYINNWWKPKAIRRYETLLESNRIKPDSLFYADIMGMTWEDTQKKYLKEVGR